MNRYSSIGATAETRCELAGRLLSRFQHEDGRTHREQQRSSDVVPQHTEAKQRGTLEPCLLLGTLGNPWSLQDGRVEIDPNPTAPARYIPMVNPEVEAGPTVTKEENGRRLCIAKKMVSEFGATLGSKGCLVIGQPHTEECRARITTRIENDPAHAKRLEDNLTRRTEFVSPKPEVAAPSEGRTNAPRGWSATRNCNHLRSFEQRGWK